MGKDGAKSRQSKVAELLSFIASDLQNRSEEQLAQLESAIEGDSSGVPTTFVAPNKSVMVHLHPRATRESAVSALTQLAQWLDKHWTEVTEEPAVDHTRWPSRSESGPNSPN